MRLIRIAALFVLGSGLVALSTPASALITWNFGSGCTAGSTGSGNFGNTCSVSAGTVTDTARAFSTTSGASNTILNTAYLGLYGSAGMGVTNQDGVVSTSCSGDQDCGEGTIANTTPPEHAMDNNQRYDMILFSFSTSVKLSQVTIGYPAANATSCSGVSPCDSDITVLAYTPTGAQPATPTLTGQTFTAAALTAAGWTFIGNYADLDAATNKTANINSSGVGSQYWIVAAYDPLYSGCIYAPTGRSNSSYCNAGDDYVKVLAVAGDKYKTPEPNSLLLFGIAATLGVWGRRRLAR